MDGRKRNAEKAVSQAAAIVTDHMRIFMLEQDEENPEFEMSSSERLGGDAPAFNPNLP